MIGGHEAGVNGFQSFPQAARQSRKADGVVGAAQSHTGQKEQSISEHDPVLFRAARQPATQVGCNKDEQRPPMYWTKGCPAHLAWTAVRALVQLADAALSSHAMRRPPPQMHTMFESHSLGHQHASVRAEQRSLAAMHAQAPSDAQAPVEPPVPVVPPVALVPPVLAVPPVPEVPPASVVPVMLPPQPRRPAASTRAPTHFRGAVIATRPPAAAGCRSRGKPGTGSAW